MWGKFKIIYDEIKFAFGVLVSLGAIYGVVYSKCMDVIDSRIKMSQELIISKVDTKINNLDFFVNDSIVLSVKRIHRELKTNPKSVKRVEVDHLIVYWGRLPESYKTRVLTRQFEEITEYYLNH